MTKRKTGKRKTTWPPVGYCVIAIDTQWRAAKTNSAWQGEVVPTYRKALNAARRHSKLNRRKPT